MSYVPSSILPALLVVFRSNTSRSQKKSRLGRVQRTLLSSLTHSSPHLTMPPRSPKKSKPNPTSTDGTDASAAAAIPITYPPPPSVRLNTPLYESYSYYSCGDVPPPSSADELLVPTVEGEGGKEGQWMIGVDEAGRGPVLGSFSSLVRLGSD